MKKNKLQKKISNAYDKGLIPLYMRFVEYSDWNGTLQKSIPLDQSINGIYTADHIYKPVSLKTHLNVLHQWDTFFSYQPIAK